jgi:multiple sugar transport system ATP-binding protein
MAGRPHIDCGVVTVADIRLEGVGKVYPGGQRAVTGVDLHIEDGEFLVFVGPSGCGKSTVLRMIAGLEEITEGKVLIGDRVINDVPPKDRDIAMVFQNYALYPHMTVADNIGFALKLARRPKEEIERRVQDAAQLLELSDYLDRKPKALSGGQRQRVAMGRAIIREPAAFLMDEPLSNLDAKLRVVMRTELSVLHERLGTTTVYVTHDQVEAMTLGQRVAVLKPYSPRRPETLQQVDRPSRLFAEPKNLFVAGFIGSPAMNLVTARLEGSDGKVDVSFGDERLTVHPAALEKYRHLDRYVGRDLVMGIRPGDFEDSRVARVVTPGMTMDVDVEVVEHLGAESFIHFPVPVPPVITPDIEELLADSDTDPSELGDISRFTARVSADVAVEVGDRITLAVDCSKLHFFDADTGDRVT